MFLTPEQLKLLTGKQVRPAQVKALRTMGIQHKVRPDGFPLVLQSHIENALDGMRKESVKNGGEPNWDAL